MSSKIKLEVKKRGWAVSFTPFAFATSVSLGDNRQEIAIPDCPQGVSLCISLAGEQLNMMLRGAAFRESEASCICSSIAESGHFHIWDVNTSQELFSLLIHVEKTPSVPDFHYAYSVPEGRRIVIGTGEDADIQISHPLHRSILMTLERCGQRWTAEVNPCVPLGVYLNTRRAAGVIQAQPGDFLTAQGLHLYLQDDSLCIAGLDEVKVKTLPLCQSHMRSGHLHYPCITRTPRLPVALGKNPIEIKDPSPVPAENKSNLIISLLPTVAMLLLTIFLRSSYASNGQMILFSVLSMALGALTSVLTYFQTGKERRKASAKRKADYRQYIAECDEHIKSARLQEQRALAALYVDPQTEISRVDDFSASLFDRRMEDPDFLDIRLGYGRMRSGQPVSCKTHEIYETTDELFRLPGELQQKYLYLDGMPALLSGKAANAAGIVGDIGQLKKILNVIVLDLAVRQYFEDMEMYFFMSERYSDELHALRLLPHVQNGENGRRSLSYDDESRTKLLEAFFRLVSERAGMKTLPDRTPWIVAFVDADDLTLMNHPVMKYVSQAASLRVLFLFLSGQKDRIPQGCASLVQLMSNVDMGLVSSYMKNQPDQLFAFDTINLQTMSRLCTFLAPVYAGDAGFASRLKGNESLFDMLGISEAGELDVLSNWRRADTTRQISAPLGLRDDGTALCLDLHESAHGPHGLVAGMTGSGKSQVLISYLLSLASRYSPEDIAFAVIDFKGGDIVKQLPGLPHIVGSITNLEKGEIERSLRSITAEKNKRMMLFDADHANVSNITEYTRAYREGKTSIPLPHLVIIVDEFAELKSQYPSFMDSLISIARVGRSLGIHLILCTQKPAGVVDGQIWSNSNFHLCLKVQNQADSNEVLRSPVAAEIIEPGRGYLQVEQQMFEMFQSGYSGFPESSASEEDASFAIELLDLSGKAELLYAHQASRSSGGRIQREAVLEQIQQAFSASGIARPAQLCQPPLPTVLPYREQDGVRDYNVLIGLYDDPDTQAIHPLMLDVTGRNTLIIGDSQMGKTNLLLMVLRRLSESMAPQDVQIYALDFNTKSLKSMESLNLIGGVVMEDEDEKLKSLFKMLRQEIVLRKNSFSQAKVTSFAAYRSLQKKLPAIVVMIDNCAGFREVYEETFGEELLFLLREGPAYGISFIVTAPQYSALSYKQPRYFSQRLVLPVTEEAEYRNVFEGCRRTLREIPGRVLFMRDKKFYEGQTFEAFSGKTELQKTEAVQAFMAAHSHGARAKAIPSVPDVLTMPYLRAAFPDAFTPGCYPFGMEYNSVSPVSVNIFAASSFSLVGGREEQRIRFLSQLLAQIIGRRGVDLFILDGFYRPLKQFNGHPAVKKYINSPDSLPMLFDQLNALLNPRLFADELTLESFAPVVVVINSTEIIKAISDNMLLKDQFQALVEGRRRMKCFFIFADLENKPVKYNSPDLIKFVSEEKQGVILGDLNTAQIYDLPLSLVRAHSRPTTPDEGFLLNGSDVARIKLCDA